MLWQTPKAKGARIVDWVSIGLLRQGPNMFLVKVRFANSSCLDNIHNSQDLMVPLKLRWSNIRILQPMCLPCMETQSSSTATGWLFYL